MEIQSITLTGEREGQNLKPIIVVLIYRPPRGQDRKCLDHIMTYLSQLKDIDKNELLIMGDLNWNLEGEEAQGIRYINVIMELYELNQHIKVPTRISANHTSLIDLMMSNINNINFAGCIDYAISDHFPTFIIKKRLTVKKLSDKIYGRPLDRLDWELFQNMLVGTAWEAILLQDDIDVMWSGVKNSLVNILNSLCPLRWIKVVTNKPMWLNSELLNIAKQRVYFKSLDDVNALVRIF